MNTTYNSKLIKFLLVFAIVSMVGIFCGQFVLAAQSHGMMDNNFSPGKNTSSMMPCCEENVSHLAIYNLPAERFLLLLASLLLAILVPAVLVSTKNYFSTFSYSFAAPSGPDLLLTVIKRE